MGAKRATAITRQARDARRISAVAASILLMGVSSVSRAVQALVPTSAPTSAPVSEAKTAPEPNPAPESTPVTPTTAPDVPPRHVLMVPAGFHIVTAGGRSALTTDADEAWVKEVLSETKGPDRPSTMPSDILSRLSARRAEFVNEICSDLGLADPKPVEAFLDSDLVPIFQKLDRLNPPIYYLVTSKEQLKAALIAGWRDPRFYYNRLSDKISFSSAVQLSIEHSIDDTVMPAMIDPANTADQNRKSLVDAIRYTEDDIAHSVAAQGPLLARKRLAVFIEHTAIDPLKLKDDQKWFGAGVAGALSCKYEAELIDVSRADATNDLTADRPGGNPLKMEAIDLLHYTNPDDLRPEYEPLYVDTLVRKATRAVSRLLAEKGDEALPKVLAAVSQNHPADVNSLVSLIKTTTGFDMTRDLAEGN